VFHEIFLHLNWHVKDDRPTLKAEIEPVVHDVIAARCQMMNGVVLHGINGTETHVHVAVSIAPHVAISEMVKELKGGGSHDANTRLNKKLLYWQRGSGVVSFGKSNLPWVLEYIARQKEHHARQSVHERLERITSFEEDV
jgi:putative transposase